MAAPVLRQTAWAGLDAPGPNKPDAARSAARSCVARAFADVLEEADVLKSASAAAERKGWEDSNRERWWRAELPLESVQPVLWTPAARARPKELLPEEARLAAREKRPAVGEPQKLGAAIAQEAPAWAPLQVGSVRLEPPV